LDKEGGFTSGREGCYLLPASGVLLGIGGGRGDDAVIVKTDGHALFRGPDHRSGNPDMDLFPLDLFQAFQGQDHLDLYLCAEGKRIIRVEIGPARGDIAGDKIEDVFGLALPDRLVRGRRSELKDRGTIRKTRGQRSAVRTKRPRDDKENQRSEVGSQN
jgi:hypothetical protein